MKSFLLFITLSLFLIFNLNAQILWQNTIGGNNFDFAENMINTSDGGFLIVGESQSNISGDKTEDSKGDADFWIVKTNNLGVVQWEKTIGGSNEDYAASAVETNDGGFAIVGISNSNVSGDKTENSKGDYDFWIVKINSTGTIVWDKTIGGDLEDYPESIVETTSGDLLIGGSSGSNISGNKGEASNGGVDYWVVKTTSTGSIIWDKTFGGSEDEILGKLRLTPDGGYIISGTSSSGVSGNKTEATRGDEDYWIIKISNTNTIDWQKTFGGTSGSFSYNFDIIRTSDSGYLISGENNSGIGGEKTEASNGGYDLWLIKINNAGTIQWQNSIGGNDDDYTPFLAEKTGGGYIVGAESLSNISGDKTENSISNDIWVVELDATGNVTGDKTFGTDSTEYPESILITSDGNFVIASNVDSLSGDNTEAPVGSTDFWLFKVDKSTLSVTSLVKKTNLKVFPVPASNQVNIESDIEIETIDIIDITGKLVSKIELPNKTLDISGLSKGIYILRLYSKSGTTNRRIIKE
tara:strand:+ start:1493 stop:3061 length:1569 start_codon:yes stop_codon:yes gene_type:complete